MYDCLYASCCDHGPRKEKGGVEYLSLNNLRRCRNLRRLNPEHFDIESKDISSSNNVTRVYVSYLSRDEEDDLLDDRGLSDDENGNGGLQMAAMDGSEAFHQVVKDMLVNGHQVTSAWLGERCVYPESLFLMLSTLLSMGVVVFVGAAVD